MDGGKFCSRNCNQVFRRKLRKRGEQEMFTNWQKIEWKDKECKRCGEIREVKRRKRRET